MSGKKAPTQQNLNEGWHVENVKSVAETFQRHGLLFVLLFKLDIIDRFEFSVLQKDFEQKVWAQIRDGE